MKQHHYRCVLTFVAVMTLAGAAQAQEPLRSGFAGWLDNKVRDMSKQEAELAKRITLRNDTKQSDTPSISSNTSSLVDRSSASDLVGIATNLAGLTSDSKQMDSSSMSVTVSAYVLKAAAPGQDPLDPAFYNRNRDWRRWSVTLGFDYPEDKVGDLNERATIFGLKYLPYDKRDASDKSNESAIKAVADKLGELAMATSKVSSEIKAYVIGELQTRGHPLPDDGDERTRALFGPSSWPNTYMMLLTEQERGEIENIIKRHLSTFTEYRTLASDTADKIRTKPQIALAFLTKQRKESRPDEHILEAIFDLAFAKRFTFTLNASFNYLDNKLAEDSRGGRFAGELQVQLNRDNLEGRRPFYLKFASDGCWMTKMPPVYRAQGKISIPIAEGIEIPLSLTYASRTDLVKEADVRGKVGFTFDIARIAQAFSGALLSARK
jgi:hypothetical protein